MSAYTGWAPQEFDESAMHAGAGNANSTPAAEQAGQPGEGTNAVEDSSGFQYDSNSGELKCYLGNIDITRRKAFRTQVSCKSGST